MHLTGTTLKGTKIEKAFFMLWSVKHLYNDHYSFWSEAHCEKKEVTYKDGKKKKMEITWLIQNIYLFIRNIM